MFTDSLSIIVMTVKISIYDHVFKASEPEIVEYSSVAEWILDNKKRLVNFAVFNGQPSNETDITKNVNALMNNTGEYVVLITPSAPVVAFVVAHWVAISVVVTVLTAGYTLYQLSNLKTPSNLNRTQQSPNNALAGRTNEPRVLQRIEDIYGQVRAYPSLLQPVYSKYIDNVQYEYSYMCIGRGWYAVDDVRDGETPLNEITGTKAEFFNPFTSPNSGSPFLTIGGSISEPVLTVKKSNNVDGAVLQARNQFSLAETDLLYFYKASTIPSSYDRIGGISNELYDNISIAVVDITGSTDVGNVRIGTSGLTVQNFAEINTRSSFLVKPSSTPSSIPAGTNLVTR